MQIIRDARTGREMVEDVFGFCCQHSSFHHDGRPRPIYHSSVHVQFLIREFLPRVRELQMLWLIRN